LHTAFWKGNFDLVMKLIMKGGDPFQENKKSESIFSELKMCCFEELATQLMPKDKEAYTIFQEKKTNDENCILDYKLLVENCVEDNGKQLMPNDKEAYTIFQEKKTNEENCILDYKLLVENCVEDNGKQLVTGTRLNSQRERTCCEREK
jgi:hypothetical protein